MKTLTKQVFLISLLFISLFFIVKIPSANAAVRACTLPGSTLPGYPVSQMCLEMSTNVTVTNLPSGKNVYIGCNGDYGNGYVINKRVSSTGACVGQYCNGYYGGSAGQNWCQGDIRQIINGGGRQGTLTGQATLTHCSCPPSADGCLKVVISSNPPPMNNACNTSNPTVNTTGILPANSGCTMTGGACGINGQTIYPNVGLTCPAPTATPVPIATPTLTPTPIPLPTPTPTPLPPPTYNVSGNVFVDTNADTSMNNGETGYPNPITITATDQNTGQPAGTIMYPAGDATKNYQISGLLAGTYTISYTDVPTGYSLTVPINGPPPSFSITLPCTTVSGSPDATCGTGVNAGFAENVNFGITNTVPWIQSVGGDITGHNISYSGGGGLTNRAPPNAFIAIPIPGGLNPGIINIGSGSLVFDPGKISATNWVVGGAGPEAYVYNVPASGIKTSYNYISSLLIQSTITPTSICTGNLTNCNLDNQNLTHGVYKIDSGSSTGDVTITGNGTPPSYTFPTGNYVILVNGNLTIDTKILVPNGSTAFFTASGDITVDKSVGQTSNTTSCAPPQASGAVSTGCDVEGYYSTDNNFIVDGYNSCATQTDKRLNIAGAIVTNALLNSPSATYINNRNLCADNANYPAFSITERPDFILNSPDFLKTSKRIWQEIAP